MSKPSKYDMSDCMTDMVNWERDLLHIDEWIEKLQELRTIAINCSTDVYVRVHSIDFVAEKKIDKAQKKCYAESINKK